MDLVITEYRNRRTANGTICKYTWEEFKTKLSTPIRTRETAFAYKNMSNEERTDIKDVGGFVGGEMKDGVRNKQSIISRSIITIDADDAKVDDAEAFKCLYDVVFFAHTTHTSTTLKPRLRWIFPLARPVNNEEYKILVKIVAGWLGADTIDESTSQPERLMFWPSVCKDGTYKTWDGGNVVLDPDKYVDDVVPEPERDETPVAIKPSIVPSITPFDLNEGSRNINLTKIAGTLHSRGIDDATCYNMLLAANESCNPPLPEQEVATIWRSVSRYPVERNILAETTIGAEDFGDLGDSSIEYTAKKNKKGRPIPRFNYETMVSLTQRYVAPPKYIVEDLFATGLTILASPPKFGKSWLCMDIGLSISRGDDFLGLKSDKTKVIYIALEDGEFRLRDRCLKVAGGREINDGFIQIREALTLEEGFVPQLEDLLEQIPDAGVVIVDTLQKIRGTAGKTEGVYGYDYRELGELQRMAIRKNIALILVHHLNKGGDDGDFVNRLNGSTGISGAADTIITLTREKRGDRNTKMSITGRDVPERTLVLQMNWNTFRWENLGDERDYREAEHDADYETSPIVRTVVDALDSLEDMLDDDDIDTNVVTWKCTSTELKAAMVNKFGDREVQEAPSVLGAKVQRLKEDFNRYSGIQYEYIDEDGKKYHKFTRFVV